MPISRHMFNSEIEKLNPRNPARNESTRQIIRRAIQLSNQSIRVEFQNEMNSIKITTALLQHLQNTATLSFSCIITLLHIRPYPTFVSYRVSSFPISLYLHKITSPTFTTSVDSTNNHTRSFRVVDGLESRGSR